MRKSDVLIEALPYIKRFHNKIAVIKYGGSILGEERIRNNVLEDIVFLSFIGMRVILVHGGGPNISERMRNQGKKSEFIEGMRVTDNETLKLVEEELNKLNAMIVQEISDLGGRVIGFSGKEDRVIQVKKKNAEIDLGLVGEVIDINREILLEKFKKNQILVICPMGIDIKDKVHNVNADEAASWIASALDAEKIVLLTNVRGIMRNSEDPNSFLSSITMQEVKKLIKDDVIQEGMIPKVEACVLAINKGVKKAHIIDARIPHALLLEIFTDSGIGTEILK
ncbi:MAG: acetylglutamate kinase [Candidatus Omnitrophica bacterium]|nr:acetylglutamate kinase [Candidatus Omnitrophota bacterium]